MAVERLVQISDAQKRARLPRFRTKHDLRAHVPVHVVWELTLACDLKCGHCGSRAGRPRPRELDTGECLEVVEALARLGTREISLIGGEAYLRRDWIEIIRAIREHGIYCAIQTGGRNLDERRLAAAAEAGLNGVGVSIDGLVDLHDRLRGVAGSHAMAIDALQRARRLGLHTSCNTQIGPQVLSQLPALMDQIIETGTRFWQVQLTVAMGNAVDNDELLLQPYQLLELMPLLARLSREGHDKGLSMIVGNNIGYFGPYERQLREALDPDQPYWTGCAAGQTAIGLESDGTVKGCPSLATVGYAGGNVRDLSLEEIWHTSDEIHFGRLRSVDDLWGFCRSCYYAEACRGGCTWTADSLFGKPGNNPYCHYRALQLARQGLRERIVKVREAPRESFAVGRFELVTEPIPGVEPPAEPRPAPRPPKGLKLEDPPADPRHEGRLPPELEPCRDCDCLIWPGETTCPHCGGDVAAAAAAWAKEAAHRKAVITEMQRLLAAAASGTEAPGEVAED